MGEWFRTARESKTGMPAKSAAVQCVDGGFWRNEKGEIERDENRRGERVCTLAYADDIVLMAEGEGR